jgi:hypothetical protein
LGERVPTLKEVLKVFRPTVTLQKGSSDVIVDTKLFKIWNEDNGFTSDYIADY